MVQPAHGRNPSVFRRQVRNRKTSVALARYRFGCDSDPGGLPVDGRHDHARAFLFFSRTRSESLPHNQCGLQSAVTGRAVPTVVSRGQCPPATRITIALGEHDSPKELSPAPAPFAVSSFRAPSPSACVSAGSLKRPSLLNSFGR